MIACSWLRFLCFIPFTPHKAARSRAGAAPLWLQGSKAVPCVWGEPQGLWTPHQQQQQQQQQVPPCRPTAASATTLVMSCQAQQQLQSEEEQQEGYPALQLALGPAGWGPPQQQLLPPAVLQEARSRSLLVLGARGARGGRRARGQRRLWGQLGREGGALQRAPHPLSWQLWWWEGRRGGQCLCCR
jgi:hypothetical protein